MKKGFLATLFAAAISFAGITAAFGAAPVISALPDLQIGDMEDNNGGATDNNYFVFTNAFQFSTHVSDADTTAGALLWSFAEYDHLPVTNFPTGQQEFQVNGKNPIYVGDAAIAAAAPGGYTAAKPPSLTAPNSLNASSDFATFRDILFSPLNQTAPFTPLVSAAQKTEASTKGKDVVFFVSDPEGNLTSDTVRVKTVDQGFDAVSSSFSSVFDQSTFTGWNESGINADGTAISGNIDDVDRTNTSGALNPATPTTGGANDGALGTIVRVSTGRYRILGWRYDGSPTIAYPGSSSFVRGKFYLYTNNTAGSAVNQVPAFRLRLSHGDGYLATLNMAYATTGNSGGTTGNIPGGWALFDSTIGDVAAGQYLRPSFNASKPSLYRVDLDPVDVPMASSGTIVPIFEAFTFVNPSAATIFMTECQVGTYPALDDASGTVLETYSRTTTAASQGLTLTGFGGATGFNAEGDFTRGYRQSLWAPAFGNTGETYAVGSEAAGASGTGLTLDTGASNSNYSNQFVVATGSVAPTANASIPRIEASKLYKARFYAVSDVTTTNTSSGVRQGQIRFRVQTAANVVNQYLEMAPPLSATFNAFQPSAGIGGQAVPGINCLNPEFDSSLTPAGMDGGWYTVLMPTPLDPDIRRDVSPTGDLSVGFGTLFSAPGPGSSSDSPKNITIGVDAYTQPLTLKIGTGTSAWGDNQRAKVSVTAAKLLSYTAVDDGAYPY